MEDEGGIDQSTTRESGGDERPSLFADIESLIDDGRILVDAELTFQKTRIAYAGSKGRAAALFGISAAVLLVFSVFALIIGLIIALAPLLTALGATALVVGVLLLTSALCGMAAINNIRKIRAAFRKENA